MGQDVDFSAARDDGGHSLFERIADDLQARGLSVIPHALPPDMTAAIHDLLSTLDTEQYNPAGIGRRLDHTVDPSVRRDGIRWIDGDTDAEKAWLDWSGQLQRYLNRRLFLGLFSFESHFALYRPGAFYRQHVDAFKNQPFNDGSHRVLSVVAYFNRDWHPQDGGELVLYDETGTRSIQSVLPASGTLVVFLSEEFPHEVKPARRDRFSIAGWYRVSGSR